MLATASKTAMSLRARIHFARPFEVKVVVVEVVPTDVAPCRV